MTESIADIMKAFVPGSVSFLLLGILAGALLVVVRKNALWLVVAWITGLGLAYVVLCLPWTANRLASWLYRDAPQVSRLDASTPTTVVVFAGDDEEGRVRETIRLYQLVRPDSVIVSGDERFRDLIQSGVPADRLVWEHQSRNTREQALHLRTLLSRHQVGRVILVASPIHMPRALGACKAVGVRAVPWPSAAADQSLPKNGGQSLLPRREALELSSEAIYEYLGLAYYRVRGWIADD